MEEIWKDIPNFEGFYQASNLGKIRSLSRMVKGHHNSKSSMTGRVLKPKISKWGYRQVTLSVYGKHHFKRVCRLIASTFLENKQNKPCVNHIDGNKINDSIVNLEWNTYSENMKHASATGLLHNVGLRGKDNKCSKSVIQYDRNGIYIKKWGSIREAGFCLSICPSSISKVCKGKYKTIGGFKWGYA